MVGLGPRPGRQPKVCYCEEKKPLQTEGRKFAEGFKEKVPGQVCRVLNQKVQSGIHLVQSRNRQLEITGKLLFK